MRNPGTILTQQKHTIIKSKGYGKKHVWNKKQLDRHRNTYIWAKTGATYILTKEDQVKRRWTGHMLQSP